MIPILSTAQYLNTAVVKPIVVAVSKNGNALHSHSNSITIPATISTASIGGVVMQTTAGSTNCNGAS